MIYNMGATVNYMDGSEVARSSGTHHVHVTGTGGWGGHGSWARSVGGSMPFPTRDRARDMTAATRNAARRHVAA